MPLTADERFWSKVQRSDGDGCWEWTASLQVKGYGQFFPYDKRGKRSAYMAHRWSYEQAFGPIPTGLFVLHGCDNRKCVRPSHLFLGAAADNTADMMAKGRHRTARKLEPDDVAAIRSAFTGELGQQAALARRFRVSPATIHRVLGRSGCRA